MQPYETFGHLPTQQQQLAATIARAEAAEARVRELETQLDYQAGLIHSHLVENLELERKLSALQWRPIAEYDAMERRGFRAVFLFPPVTHRPGDLQLSMMLCPERHAGRRVCTHFLQLPPVPGE